MKTKKMIALLLTLCLSLFLFAGCTPAMEAYSLENERVQAWPGAKLSGQGIMETTAEGQQIPMSFAYTGITQGIDKENALVQINMTFDPITVEGQSLQLPAMDLYIDTPNNTVYINTDYFIDYFKLSGITHNPFAHITTDFIELDLRSLNADPAKLLGLSTVGAQYLSSPAFAKDTEELTKTLFKNIKPPFSFEQEGRTFTTDATIEELVDGSVAGLDHIMANWDTFVPQFIDITTKMGTPATEAELNHLKAQYDAKTMEQVATQLKTAFKGTTFSMVETFTDTTYTSDFAMNLTTTVEGTTGSTVLYMVNEQIKEENANVTLPTDVTKISLEDLLAAFANPTGTIQVLLDGKPIAFDQEPIIINDRVMVPFRAIGEATGATVEWEESNRSVTMNDITLTIGSNQALVGDNIVPLDTPATIVGDRTLIPLRFFGEHLGYQVEWFGAARVVVIETAA